MPNDLLTDIHAFIRETGMGPSYFGKAACGNSELVERLEKGGTVTLTTAERIRSFMASRSKVTA
jgi:hypothetical protein